MPAPREAPGPSEPSAPDGSDTPDERDPQESPEDTASTLLAQVDRAMSELEAVRALLIAQPHNPTPPPAQPAPSPRPSAPFASLDEALAWFNRYEGWQQW
jgi:hypothetical protein